MTDCQCHSRGSIHLILGPMFSGKTTELFRLTKRHTLAGKNVAVLKYARDNRYDSAMACTHDFNKMEAISAVKLADVINDLEHYDVIGIDEGQFFEDVVKFSQDLANSGKIVIIAALNGDYRQKPFQNIASLTSFAERIEKLSAVCRLCGHSASFTYRSGQCTKREVIGGEDLYQAVCRSCYILLHESGAENNGVSVELKPKPLAKQISFGIETKGPLKPLNNDSDTLFKSDNSPKMFTTMSSINKIDKISNIFGRANDIAKINDNVDNEQISLKLNSNETSAIVCKKRMNA